MTAIEAQDLSGPEAGPARLTTRGDKGSSQALNNEE